LDEWAWDGSSTKRQGCCFENQKDHVANMWWPRRERQWPGGGAEDPDHGGECNGMAYQFVIAGRRTAKLATPHARHSTQLQAKATK
jgi:hypothetical protein